jgi:hypothetical protein
MKATVLCKNGFKIANLNRRKAIHERCLNCSGWIPKEVTDCTFTECPLYLFRSGDEKQNPKKRKEAIRKYCLWCMNAQHSEVVKCVSPNCPLYRYRLKEIDINIEINTGTEKVHIDPVSDIKTVLHA